MERSIGDFVDESMTIFGNDVNKERQLPSVYDGLKPSYRRILFTALNRPDAYTKVADIVGTCIATNHPHGDQSLLQPVSNMVRWGVMDGHGNHGAKAIIGNDIEKSAPRYIGVKIATHYREFFSGMMPYVPYRDAEIKGVEPCYLPTPYPICLTFGTMGIGIGVNCRIPCFTLQSLHDAHINNDPYHLEAPFGMILDKDNSELDQLWEKGIGKVTYKYKVEKYVVEGCDGALISGSAEIFKPLLTEFTHYLNDGRVFTIDLSDGDGDKLFLGRSKGVRTINSDIILEMAQRAATYTKTYRLTVADENNVYLIPLKWWLKFTYDNYIKLVNDYKHDQIEKLKFDYLVYKYLPEVADCLYNNRDFSSEDICNKLNEPELTLNVVNAILQKSISTLRKVNSTDKLNKITDKIHQFEAIIPEDFIHDIIVN